MANLTTTITESVTVNGQQRGSTNTLTINDIVDTLERTITCAHSNITTIVEFNTSNHAAESALDRDNVKYIRITNLSTTDECIIGIISGSTNYQVRLTPGGSHILLGGADVATAEADADPAMSSMTDDLSAIEVQPVSSTNVQVELFVASI
tara:strand:- start:476 stop:928 length:453 start_codon:yes stop_codon:yes gene_type:complete